MAIKKALLVAKTPLDMLGNPVIEAFVIEGDEPAGTDRKFLMRWVNPNLNYDKIVKFIPNAIGSDTFVPVSVTDSDGNIDIDAVLSRGNNASDFKDLHNFHGGTIDENLKIYPIIALASNSDAKPTAGFGIITIPQVLPYSEERTYANLTFGPGKSKIVNISHPDAFSAGHAYFDVKVAYMTDFDGHYSDYLPPQDIYGVEAQLFSIKITRTIAAPYAGGYDDIDTKYAAYVCTGPTYIKFTSDTDSLVLGDYADLYKAIKRIMNELGFSRQQTTPLADRGKKMLAADFKIIIGG